MRLKDWVLFFLLGMIWSSSFMWIKIAVREVSPTTLVAVRVLLGCLFAAGVVWVTRARLPRVRGEWVPLLLLGVTNIAVPFFLISWGEQSIDSAVASILDATVPLFTLVFAHFLLGDDRITPAKGVGLITGFLGVVVLVSRSLTGAGGSLAGEAAVVVASMFYAGSAIYARRTTADTPSALRSFGPLLSATVVMWAAAFVTERPLALPRLPLSWLALSFLGLLGSGLALVLAFYLIHQIGPTRATMVTYLFPLGGVTLGVLVLGEALTWQLVAGAALILAGLVIANRPSQSRAAESLEGENTRPSLA